MMVYFDRLKTMVAIVVLLFCIGCSPMVYRVEICRGVIPGIYERIQGTSLEKEWVRLDTLTCSKEEYERILKEWEYGGGYVVVSDECKGPRIIEKIRLKK